MENYNEPVQHCTISIYYQLLRKKRTCLQIGDGPNVNNALKTVKIKLF